MILLFNIARGTKLQLGIYLLPMHGEDKFWICLSSHHEYKIPKAAAYGTSPAPVCWIKEDVHIVKTHGGFT